jgi:hypothetical protein
LERYFLHRIIWGLEHPPKTLRKLSTGRARSAFCSAKGGAVGASVEPNGSTEKVTGKDGNSTVGNRTVETVVGKDDRIQVSQMGHLKKSRTGEVRQMTHLAAQLSPAPFREALAQSWLQQRAAHENPRQHVGELPGTADAPVGGG